MNDPLRALERDRMVKSQIRARGIGDRRVLDALAQVPRHRFVPAELSAHAYGDHALAIGKGQTISQPYMVGAMTEALDLRGPERVLEVGTGSGYQCAVLACLAAEVFSIERIASLAESAHALLTDLDFENVQVRTGDGSMGWAAEAPFDAILVTAGAPAPPPALLDQLNPDGGRLVAPVGDRDLQQVVRVLRHGSEFTKETMLACRFVPLLGEEGWPVAP
jgi:protein-L-isoaspartate(D-aspartate) O-methyltransferase